ncbi:sensor histidine kinase [Streptomyces sp. NPDC002536]
MPAPEEHRGEGIPVAVHIGWGTLAVRDQGPGIAPSERHAVFDRFHRGPRTQATPGSGLGLAIVHDIITADAGTAFATTAHDGGAEVGFRLPPHGQDGPNSPTARRRSRRAP